MQPSPPVLVISRSAEQERRIQRDGLIVIISQACNVALCVLITLFLFQHKKIAHHHPVYPMLSIAAGCFGLYAMYNQIRWRRVNRQMRHLQLAVTQHGVTYASTAGTYSAPWSAVHRIRLYAKKRSGPHLVIDVEDWGGPLDEVGRVGRLAIPIADCGADELEIRQAIAHLSGGAVMASRR